MSLLTETKADLSKSSVSRYLQLAMLFRRRIESGQWRVEEQIPTVDELAAEYGVSRATIRQAVGLLEAEGLVSRFRAKGTFVTKHPLERLWCEVETNWNGLLNARAGADIRIIQDSTGPLTFPPPHDVGTPSDVYRHLKRLHSKDGARYLVADVFIDAELAASIPQAELTSKTSACLATRLPGTLVADARQTLTIGAADVENASLLDIPLNAPICFIDRSVIDQQGRLILLSRGVYKGDVVRLDIKLR